jgi:uncharacterized membrane protein
LTRKMAAWHPLVIHFPIALIILWPIVEGIGLWTRRTDISHVALGFLVLALLASFIGTVTGQAAFDAAIERGANAEVLRLHSDKGDLVPWVMFIVVFMRTVGVLKLGRRAQIASVVLGVLVWMLIWQVGDTGGELVYRHGVGVERVQTQ